VKSLVHCAISMGWDSSDAELSSCHTLMVLSASHVMNRLQSQNAQAQARSVACSRGTPMHQRAHTYRPVLSNVDAKMPVSLSREPGCAFVESFWKQ